MIPLAPNPRFPGTHPVPDVGPRPHKAMSVGVCLEQQQQWGELAGGTGGLKRGNFGSLPQSQHGRGACSSRPGGYDREETFVITS